MSNQHKNAGQYGKDSRLNFPNFQAAWIRDGIKQEAIDYAEKLGAFLPKNGFTTSQIRNFFGEVRRIQQRKGISDPANKTAFLLLKPKIAYAAKRADKIGAHVFKDEILKAYNIVLEDEANLEAQEFKFHNFCDLLEAILAFHKANNGK